MAFRGIESLLQCEPGWRAVILTARKDGLRDAYGVYAVACWALCSRTHSTGTDTEMHGMIAYDGAMIPSCSPFIYGDLLCYCGPDRDPDEEFRQFWETECKRKPEPPRDA